MSAEPKPTEPNSTEPVPAGPVPAGPTPAELSVPDRILIAAVDVAAHHGIARLSVGDVAKRAGLSRQTLYKHFPSKQVLVAAAVVREATRLVDQVSAAAAVHEDPRAALEVGVLTALRLTREHPVLDRLLRTEPEALLPLIAADGGPVMTLVRGGVEQVAAVTFPTLSPEACRGLCDVIGRLLISYAVTAPEEPPEVVAASLAALLIHGVLGPAVPA